jgi:dipeptidyl aminopeptidase/acylaminoacyl peptidase
MKLRIALLACAGLSAIASAVTAVSASPMPIDQAAKLFGARPTAFAVDLSPDGDKLVYLSAGPGASTVAHLEDLTKKTNLVLTHSSGKPSQLYWCGFADERWIVCQFGGEMSEAGLVYAVARTVALDTTTGAVRQLGARLDDTGDQFLQFDGEIIDWLPDEQGSVLMQRDYAGQHGNAVWIGVDHIQLDPFKVSVVEPAIPRDLDYMTDGHGIVRLRSAATTDINDDFTGTARYEYRTAADGKWLALSETDADFTPLAVDRSSNSLYFLKPLNGRAALYRMALDGSGAETLVASNPDVDIDSVIRLSAGGPVVGYRYTDDRTHSVYTDPKTKSLGAALAKALPQMPLINFVASSRDGDKLLIHAGSDVDPGVFFLLDLKTLHMDPVLNSSDLIDGSGLAPMKAVSVPTSDGKSIPAYVTMRSDLGPGPHPTVVMPHGGPSDRDTWGFDWLGQFLAARGYVVIQPNFRGSSGYGKGFLGENAFHEWRKVMSDIHDSADWLVKQGLADPNRMAILGWSYGGYAALQSAAMDHRYKAVVAIAPVTDLKRLRRDVEGFRQERVEKEEIGKGDQLVDGSPINHAADIHAPVLLVHGTLDGNVDYDHSKHMLAALQHAGASADLLTFEGLDHQLSDSDARTQMLTRIGELLDRTIGH